jgi:small subunit ribosomal protein S1
MQDYLDLNTEGIPVVETGEILNGTVVQVSDKEILVDVGGKSEGIIEDREINAKDEETLHLKVGEEIRVLVLKAEDDYGHLILSYRQAQAEGDWTALELAGTAGEPIEVEVQQVNKGGVVVRAMGLRGFLPIGQVARDIDPKDLINQNIHVKLLEVNRKRNRVIVSQRVLFEDGRQLRWDKLLARVKIGDLVTGKVVNTTTYGAFINIDGIDGLAHISELAWGRVKNVDDIATPGSEVTAKIVGIDLEKQRISLSIKQATEDPWQTAGADDKYKVGSKVTGVVTKIKDYGVFIKFEDDLEGLIHITELADEPVEKTIEVLNLGDKVEATIVEVDKNVRRIALSRRANPTLILESEEKK